jgi:excisionase family DNA binding protein
MTTAPDDDPWLTVPEVSEKLKLHPATVRIWINNGRLAAVRAGRTWRVRQSETERALMSDASPGYAHARSDTTPASGEAPAPARTDAPRNIADHIMAVVPRSDGGQ